MVGINTLQIISHLILTANIWGIAKYGLHLQMRKLRLGDVWHLVQGHFISNSGAEIGTQDPNCVPVSTMSRHFNLPQRQLVHCFGFQENITELRIGDEFRAWDSMSSNNKPRPIKYHILASSGGGVLGQGTKLEC